MTTDERRIALVTALVGTMAFSTIQLYAVAVLASDIRADLGLSRTEIGLLGAVNTGVGALMSPFTGRIVDRVGAKRSAMAVLVGSGLGMLATAGSPGLWPMLGAAVVAGVAQSGGNPSTNKLIALHVPLGRRGVITGMKQSGVTLSLFLAGLTLPGASQLIGWRWGVVAYGVLSVGLATGVLASLPEDPQTDHSRPGGNARTPIPTFVFRVAIYGALMGFTTGGTLRFIALFSEEELGYSETVAGLVAALVGLGGIAARITWGRLAEHHVPTRTALALLAGLAVGACGLLALAPDVGAWLIWPTALLLAFSAVAWNVVGNLAIIRGVDPRAAGGATGILLLGFLSGLSFGAPATGAIVDATDQYPLAWLAMAFAAVAALVVVATGPEPPVHDQADVNPS